jgi:pantetheine-phosphate adenylyltransferase
MLSQPSSQSVTPVLSRTHTATSGDDVTTLSSIEKPPFYPVVALGGTFDHLHPGHKILLSMGAWIASEKLIVGVTSSTLLTKKPNAHLVEPLEVRMQNVRDFLNRFKKGLELYIVELNDVYGPTGWDPNVQALVVSRETISGAKESQSLHYPSSYSCSDYRF